VRKQPSAKNNVQRFALLRDKIRKHLLKYTRKAFCMIPQINRPRILDIGCGSGIPTLELAKLSRGEVIGIDIDQPALDKFTAQIAESGLSDRVKALNCSLINMDFPNEAFDIIWSEGSIYAIGFEKGLGKWKRFLKPGGFLVIHDEQGNVKEKLEQISKCDYELLGYFTLSKETWQSEYFAPLEKLIIEAETRYLNDPKVIEEIQQAQGELDMFKQNPECNSSVYFIIKKGDTEIINQR
jgi:ubiquinone/menaquinone biosynthesis C-methylase UbiE